MHLVPSIDINSIFSILRQLKTLIEKSAIYTSAFKQIFFFFVFCLSQLADQLTNSFNTMQLDFICRPFLKVHPPILRDYSTCNNARLEFSTIFVPSFDPNEWCLKNGLHSGDLIPGPLGHESSALTTRPRLLASNRFFNVTVLFKNKVSFVYLQSF